MELSVGSLLLRILRLRASGSVRGLRRSQELGVGCFPGTSNFTAASVADEAWAAMFGDQNV